MKQLVGLLVLAWSLTGWGAPQKVLNPEEYVVCKNAGVVRTIRVEKVDDGETKCLVNYTKLGNDNVVGSGSTLTGCSIILDRVKKNLEKHWWICRDVENITMVKLTNPNDE